MAISGQLANLFVDITLRGGAKAQIKDIKDRIESTDKALANSAVFYKAVTGEKIRQMGKLADNQRSLSKVDQRTYGSMPYAGYANKQAKADVASEIAGKQKSIALSRAELQALSGKRGVELATKTVQADRVKKQVEELKNQQIMVAQYGKIGATIRQAGASMSILGKLSPTTLIGASVAGISAGYAGSQASPERAATLSTSFDLLAAQIGTHLLPAMDALSGAAQSAANLFGKIPKPAPGTYAGTGTLIGAGIGTIILPGLGTIIGGIIGSIGGSFFKGKDEPTRTATGPAHFEALDQAWRRIQQQAASTGDLEQQLLQIQVANLPQQTRALNQIAINTTPQGQPVPLPP